METHTHTEVVAAPLELCFDVLVDFAHYPQWFGMIQTARIAESDPAAGTWTVEYELHAIVRTIRYTLSYQSKRPHLLSWKMTAGDLSAIKGSYELVELEPGLTEATCTQALDVGFWVPGPLRRIFEQSALTDSVREFKQAAEERADEIA